MKEYTLNGLRYIIRYPKNFSEDKNIRRYSACTVRVPEVTVRTVSSQIPFLRRRRDTRIFPS